VSESKDKDYLHALALRKIGIHIDEIGKLKIDAAFCVQQIQTPRISFGALFAKAGWET